MDIVDRAINNFRMQIQAEEDKRILEPAKENDFIVKPKKLK